MEDWFKFERIKVLQDSYGMAYQANFAIIDTIKWEDLGNYKYSFKHITTPLNKAMPKNGKDEVGWLIKKEEGFEPVKDIDLKSLRFGISEEVNFGRGSKALRIDEHAGGGDQAISILKLYKSNPIIFRDLPAAARAWFTCCD